MKVGDPHDRRRFMALGAAALLVIVIVAIVIFRGSRGGGTSGSIHDDALKRTADRALPQLNRLNPKFPVTDSSLTSFQAWVYGRQKAFTALIHTVPKGQAAQLQFMDPNTMPPQSLSLTAPGHPGVFVDVATLNRISQSHHPEYATVPQGGQTFRVYIVPLTTPAVLTPVGCTAVLQIYQVQ